MGQSLPVPRPATDRRTLEDTLVVDVDVHVDEDPLTLARYCERPWREALEETRFATRRYLDIPGFSVDWAAIEPPVPGRFVEGEAAGPRPDAAWRVVRFGGELERQLCELQADLAIVFPDHLLSLAVLPNPLYAAAVARAYTRWLTEEVVGGSDMLYGAVVAVPHDPQAGAAEIRRYAGHPRVRALYLPTAAVAPLWGDRRNEPIFDAAQEADLPVCRPRPPELPAPGELDRDGAVPARAVPRLAPRQGVQRAAPRAGLLHGAAEPLREALLLRDPAGRGAGRPARARRADRGVRRRRPLHVRLGLAPPRHPRQVFRLPLDEESRAKIMGETAYRVFRLGRA